MKTKEEILKDIYIIYKETEDKIEKIKTVKVKDNKMVDADIQLLFKAHGYQRIKEIFKGLERRKERGGNK